MGKKIIVNIDDLLKDQDNPAAEIVVIQRMIAVNMVTLEKVTIVILNHCTL